MKRPLLYNVSLQDSLKMKPMRKASYTKMDRFLRKVMEERRLQCIGSFPEPMLES